MKYARIQLILTWYVVQLIFPHVLGFFQYSSRRKQYSIVRNFGILDFPYQNSLNFLNIQFLSQVSFSNSVFRINYDIFFIIFLCALRSSDKNVSS